MAEFFGVDSLAYLSHDGLVAAVGEGLKLVHPEDSGLCSACLTGVYPVDLEW
jgi:glutamine phosphoribosylpyrophosphate amidotransferase